MKRLRISPALFVATVLSLMNMQSSAATPRVHTTETFQFSIAAPLAVAFPLFGANRERLWAPDWTPSFVWPAEPEDRPGMVFEIAEGEHAAVWVNTDFDQAAGRVQYVYVIPGIMTTLITLRLRERGKTTDVQVRYERTSLSQSADERVRERARHDAQAGPEWAEQIASALKDQAGR